MSVFSVIILVRLPYSHLCVIDHILMRRPPAQSTDDGLAHCDQSIPPFQSEVSDRTDAMLHAVARPREPSSHAPSVTVVICTCNRPTELFACLTALAKQRDTQFETLVVDNAPGHGDAKAVAARFGVGYLAEPHRGLSRARNAGLVATWTEIVAYLDDDMIPEEHWLTQLLSGFDHPGIACVTGPVAHKQDAGIESATLQYGFYAGSVSFTLSRQSRYWFESANFGGIGDGNFAVRREAMIAAGGFNVHLGRGALIDGGEEHYAFFRLVHSGYAASYVPEAVVFHPRQPMTSQLKRHAMAINVAYALVLAIRHPQYLGRLTRFFIQGLLRVRRPWRHDPSRASGSMKQARFPLSRAPKAAPMALSADND
jgi:GT2 family glycosyltransferase